MTPVILASGFNHLKSTRYGYMLYNHNDVYVGRSFEHYGEFSEGEVEVFRQIVQPGFLMLDIGANIGAHTLFFAQAVTTQGSVLAFEPQRVLFQTLCANLALNSKSNVYCYQAALGETAGQIIVPQFDFTQVNNYGGLSLDQRLPGESVPVMTVDGFNLPACHFMKIDVEGMEEVVLTGAQQTIAKYRPILYVENDRQHKSASLIRFIAGLNYKMYWHLPPLYNPNNYFGNADNIFGEIVSVNMLCVHREFPINLEGFREVSGPDDNWQM